jgi:hypothetical protein
MSGRKKPSGEITAAELVAQLAADPDYLRKTASAEAERQSREQELRRAEEPIVRDLNEVGVGVSSVWDLVNTSDPYPNALPVLLDHLRKGGYPDRVMESLGRALAVEPAAFAWETLRDLYLIAEGRGEEEGLAVALAASATVAHLDGLIALLHENSRGDSRIHFLRAIKRTGGAKGRDLLASLRSDPMFGREARALLNARDY